MSEPRPPLTVVPEKAPVMITVSADPPPLIALNPAALKLVPTVISLVPVELKFIVEKALTFVKANSVAVPPVGASLTFAVNVRESTPVPPATVSVVK